MIKQFRLKAFPCEGEKSGREMAIFGAALIRAGFRSLRDAFLAECYRKRVNVVVR